MAVGWTTLAQKQGEVLGQHQGSVARFPEILVPQKRGCHATIFLFLTLQKWTE